MSRLALTLALGALVVAILPAPAQLVAIGLALAAIGTGAIGYARRAAPGGCRLLAAAAVTLGCLGLVLGVLRVILTLAAIHHIEGMVTS